jgi:hypothetical protein
MVLPFESGGPPGIDPCHDPLGNRNRIGDGRLKCGGWTTVPVRQLSDCEDTGGYQRNSFSSLVDLGNPILFAYSSLLGYNPCSEVNRLPGKEFASCCSKIERADEHINSLKGKLKEWRDSGPYVPIKKIKAKGRRHSVIVNVKNKPSIQSWSLIAGDAIHNLRSALDHLAVAICRDQVKQLTEKEERAIQFPICDTPENFEEFIKRRLKPLVVAKSPILNPIRLLQPYSRSQFRHSSGLMLPPLLGLLRDFDDADKHRLLNVVIANVTEGKLRILSDTNAAIKFAGHHIGGLEDGTEIMSFTVDPPDPKLQYYSEAAIVVSIVHPETPQGRNYTELAAILDFLREEVVFAVNTIRNGYVFRHPLC